MAKNWTLKEAVSVITKGTNKEAIQELGKKFPLASIAIAKMGTNAGIEQLFDSMPEHMTMLKMERSMKEGVASAGDEDEDINQPEEVDAEEEVTESDDLDAKTTKQLYEMCIKKGLKVSKYGKPKSYYIEQLTGAGECDGDDEEDVSEEAEAGPDYNEMTAIELFKLCKKRGIPAEPKKKAATYIKLLQEADSNDVEEEEEDWDDEEEKPAEKKAAKGKQSKSTTKGKAVKEEDEEEEDWDI